MANLAKSNNIPVLEPTKRFERTMEVSPTIPYKADSAGVGFDHSWRWFGNEPC